MSREKRMALGGGLLLAAAAAAVMLLCTNTRIDPELRRSYEISAPAAEENADMALFLQMLNNGGGAGAHE